MELNKIDCERYYLDVKRLYAPYILKCKCEHCGNDLQENYLERAIMDAYAECTSMDYIYCDECEKTTAIKIKISVHFELLS